MATCTTAPYTTPLGNNLVLQWGVEGSGMCSQLGWVNSPPSTDMWMGLGFGTQMLASTPVITQIPAGQMVGTVGTYVNGAPGNVPSTTTSYSISMAQAGVIMGIPGGTWLRSDGFNPTGLNSVVWANGANALVSHSQRGVVCLNAADGSATAGPCPATTGVATTGVATTGTTTGVASTTGVATTGVATTGTTTGVASTTGAAGNGTTTGAGGNGTTPSSPPPSSPSPSSPAPSPAASTSDAPLGLATSAVVGLSAVAAAARLC